MAKNIIICCDGTGNEFSTHNTNVVNTYQATVRNNEQVAFYDPGVGTFNIFGRRFGKYIGIKLGEAFGYGLTDNIEDAYFYLMENYEVGDKIFLFGFSRGAFTVRALSGMLQKVGLLQKGSNNMIPYATQMYLTLNNNPLAESFKKTYSHECIPHFIGVWDTVGSLGLFFNKDFIDIRLHDVPNAYHAVSIDERRKKFPVTLWSQRNPKENQIIEQVWFPGVHSDIGGSYDERHISDITLHWMLRKAQKHGML